MNLNLIQQLTAQANAPGTLPGTTILIRKAAYALEEAEKDVARMNWLCRCTAGEWEVLNNMRLANHAGFLRMAIDNLTGKN